MSSLPPSNRNSETITLDSAAERENLNCISKFGLPTSNAQHIDFCFILNDIHIDDSTTVLNIKFNSWVFNCLKSYQFSSSLVIYMMLKVFRDEFYRWGYTEFSKLDQHIRQTFKETLMAKGIYIGQPSSHVNQYLVNLIINKQLPA